MASTGELVDSALAILTALHRGDGAGAAARFSERIAKRLTPEGVVAAWRQFVDVLGGYRSWSSVTIGDSPQGTMVRVMLSFERGHGELRVTYTDSRVVGIWLLPAVPGS